MQTFTNDNDTENTKSTIILLSLKEARALHTMLTSVVVNKTIPRKTTSGMMLAKRLVDELAIW